MPRKRSSYNNTVASQFKNLFDDVIVDRQDRFIEVPLGKSTDGFRQKCTDALLYLMRELDYEHEDYKGRKHVAGDYARLRGLIKIKYQSNNTLHLSFFVNNLVVKAKPTETSDTWKQTIQEYLTNNLLVNKPLIIRNIELNNEEQIYAAKLFKDFGLLTGKQIVYDIGPTEIYGMKLDK